MVRNLFISYIVNSVEVDAPFSSNLFRSDSSRVFSRESQRVVARVFVRVFAGVYLQVFASTWRFLHQFDVIRMSCCLATSHKKVAGSVLRTSPWKYDKDSGQAIHVTSDQYLISPNNISALSSRQVVRINKIIN